MVTTISSTLVARGSGRSELGSVPAGFWFLKPWWLQQIPAVVWVSTGRAVQGHRSALKVAQDAGPALHKPRQPEGHEGFCQS